MSRSKLNRRKNAKRAVRVLAGEVQQLERRSLLTGTVTIALVGNNLTVTGDSGNNDVRIEVSEAGVTAQGYVDSNDDIPINLTKIKFGGVTYKAGELVELVSAEDLAELEGALVLGNLIVNMGAGNDQIEVSVGAQDEGDTAIDLLKVSGILKIDLGTGSDRVYVGFNETDLEVVGAASVIGGAGDDDIDVYAGGEEIDSTATFKSTLTVDSGAGSDDVYLKWDELNVKGNELITTGDGSDYAYQGFNGESLLQGRLDFKTGNGDDYAYQNFNDDATINSTLNFEGGNGSDELGIVENSNVHVTIKGNLSFDGGVGAGDDYVYVEFGDSGSSLSVLGDLTIKTGDGDNGVYINVNDLSVGNTASATAAAKNINIEEGNDSDYVSLIVGLTVTGGVNIATGGGDDSVFVRIEDVEGEPTDEAFPADTIGKSLTIDTANNLALLGINYAFDSRGGDDADEVYVGFNSDEFTIKGNLDIRTGNGGDIAYVDFNGNTEDDEHSAGDFTINGDLKINSGLGDDLVGVQTHGSAVLLVKGNADLNLGGILADTTLDGHDCLIVGDEISIAAGLGLENFGLAGSIDVTKNFTVKGGNGDDHIGLSGLGVGGNLLVNADAGDDVVGGFGLQIGGNLTVNGGLGDDLIGAQGAEDNEFTVGGNTTVDAGLGNDTVLVDFVTFGANDAAARFVNVNLNAGNDNIAASNVTAGDGLTTVTINGGANTDQGLFDDSIDDDEPGVSVLGIEVINGEDEDDFNQEDAEAAQDAIIDALKECLYSLNGFDD